MAVIFFDGFYHAPDLNYWNLTGETGHSAVGVALEIYPNENLSNKAVLNATANNSKVYFGIRISNYVIASLPQGQPFLTFKYANQTSNDTLFEIRWGAPGNFPEVGFYVVAGNTSAYYSLSQSIPNITWAYADIPAGRCVFYPATTPQVDLTPCTSGSAYRTLEIEIDLAAEQKTVALRMENSDLLTDSLNAIQQKLFVLPAETPNHFNKIEIYGSTAYNVQGCNNAPANIDAMYLVDNFGAHTNSWLGKNFDVISSSFLSISSGAPNGEWFQFAETPQFDLTYIQDNDLDYSYIETDDKITEKTQTVSDLQPLTSFSQIWNQTTLSEALVGGVSLRNVARGGNFGDFVYTYLYYDGANTVRMYGSQGAMLVINDTQYKTQATQFIGDNPTTSQQWHISTDIFYGPHFGFKTVIN